MEAIAPFLQYLPEAASSPLALVAYFLVVGAWALRTWLYINPTRDARRILAQYKDDAERTIALTKIFNEQLPRGLKGNDAILAWVRNKSLEKTRVLFVVAWLATLVAVLVLVVAVRVAPAQQGGREISINFHRGGSADSCPSLPIAAHIRIASASGETLRRTRVIAGCKSTFVVAHSAQGLAKLELEDAQPYELTRPAETYQLAAKNWHVDVSQFVGEHLLLSMFSYAGECKQTQNAFETFREILRSKAASLRTMFPGTDPRYEYLSRVNVNAVGKTLDLSAAEVRTYWQQTGSLQILSGLCFIRDDAEIMRSQIFSGPLAGSLPEPFLAELAISPDEFGATRDIHTVAMLYALAQEAGSRKLDRDVVIAYLASARAIIAQSHEPAAKQMMRAIDKALQDAGAPTSRSL
jgi:hypothetical protein